MPPRILRCGHNQPDSKTERIDQNGGKVTLRGHQLRVPAGAVTGPTDFTLSIPGTDRVEVDVVASGPLSGTVELTINYVGCSGLPKEDLKIWRLDANRNPRDDLGGTDDRVGRRVTTSLSHLSGYGVAQG